MSTKTRIKTVSELRAVWNSGVKTSSQTAVSQPKTVIKPALNNTIVSQFTRIILPKKVLYKLSNARKYN